MGEFCHIPWWIWNTTEDAKISILEKSEAESQRESYLKLPSVKVSPAEKHLAVK